MNDIEYPGNSYASRKNQTEKEVPSERKVEKVIKGSATVKKKFAGSLFSEDVANVGSHILMNVIIPSVRDVIVDVVTDAAKMIFYGEKGMGKKGSSSIGSKVSYRQYYDSDRQRSEPSVKSHFDYDDISLDSRGDAEEVLIQLDDIIERYKVARVADLYELIGVTPPYTAYKYGWSSLKSAKVVATRRGYSLDLPRAIPLD